MRPIRDISGPWLGAADQEVRTSSDSLTEGIEICLERSITEELEH